MPDFNVPMPGETPTPEATPDRPKKKKHKKNTDINSAIMLAMLSRMFQQPQQGAPTQGMPPMGGIGG